MIPLFVLPFTLLVMLASSSSGDLYSLSSGDLYSLRCTDHHPIRIGGQTGTAGNRFARDEKELGPSWGEQLTGERPRETAKTWHTSQDLYSGKLIFAAAIYLRQVGIDGRSYVVAPTQGSTVITPSTPAAKKSRRRPAAALLGRCEADQSKYKLVYLYCGKVILAAIYLRFVRVAGPLLPSRRAHHR
jgi:hypothetical protein